MIIKNQINDSYRNHNHSWQIYFLNDVKVMIKASFCYFNKSVRGKDTPAVTNAIREAK